MNQGFGQATDFAGGSAVSRSMETVTPSPDGPDGDGDPLIRVVRQGSDASVCLAGSQPEE